jgi:DNA invertase Pin-like site-specific DNA recombinase
MKKIRVGCMVRVSHEEQARDGLSIQTQIEHLKSYVEEHKELVLVDFYVDEGVSADKLKQRIQFQRLLKDVQEGKIDMILFTKLDRWFRSVEKYYQVQPILEKNNVVWKAILEDFETESANGRFKVNLYLSLGQVEREKASERIKDVFQYKVKNGEALYGDEATPFGFAVVDKKMVHNKDEEEIVKVLLNHYYVYQSVRKTVMFAQSEYGILLSYPRFRRLLSSTMLYECYRDNLNYCEPYITKERFDEIQAILKKNIRVRNAKYEYIFSGLITCPICGCNMVGTVSHTKRADGTKRVHLGYRCDGYFLHKNECGMSIFPIYEVCGHQLL